jgi:hypothetical protein
MQQAKVVFHRIIFNAVVARGGTLRWNRYITPDLCLATSWLRDLIYTTLIMQGLDFLLT